MKNLPNIAIYLPNIGARTETFIRRHALELFPQEQVWFITDRPSMEHNDWFVDQDRVFYLNQFKKSPFVKEIINASAKKVGVGDVYTIRKEFQRFIKKNNISVLLAEYLNNPFIINDYLQGLNLRFFAHGHGYDMSRLLKDDYWAEKYLKYNDFGEVITVTEFSKKQLVKYGIDGNRIHVIPYGIPLLSSDCYTIQNEERNSDNINIVSVGRLVAKKAPIHLLESFRLARQKCFHIHLHLIGDGYFREAVLDYIEINGLSKSVTYYDSLPYSEVLDVISKADIFMQHSVTDRAGDQEGLPLAILEAMSVGLPIISTLHAGIPEAVEHGVNGLLSKERDCSAMAEHIVELAQDSAVRHRFGMEGRNTIEINFTWMLEKERLRALMCAE